MLFPSQADPEFPGRKVAPAMSFLIGGVGTALPEHQVEQTRAAELTSRVAGHDPAQTRRLAALYRRSGVRTRHVSLLDRLDVAAPLLEPGSLGPTTEARMAHYEAAAAPLALLASARALAASETDPLSITHLVTVSCTGFAAPGFDLALIEGLHLNRGVARTHVGFMGCHGALNGLRVARAFAESEPSSRVLICATELCSLHFRYGWDADQAVSNALFGDGSAAVVGFAGKSTTTGSDVEDPWRLVASGSTLLPSTGDSMSWRVGDHGFAMTLSAQVAGHITEHLRPWLSNWLSRQGLDLSEVGCWAVHPGGPRILDAVQEGLGLGPDALAVSREVLAKCGNMSSPTVLFILDRLRQRNSPRPCVALGFGPGLVIEAALLL